MTLELTTTTSVPERTLSRIRLRTARVCVVGLGYVGLPLAETFAWAGYPILGYDIDREKIKKLKTGQSYIGHISSRRIAELVSTGRFEPTTNPSDLEQADVIVICVPTPLTEAREPDLSFVTGTARMIAQHLRRGQLIVLESTTYPGTTEELIRPLLEQTGMRLGRDFFLAYSPEREDPGNPHYSTRLIPKVVGGCDPDSLEMAVALYKPVAQEVLPVSSTQIAEACKILENTYRVVNIALVNELKVVFDRMGIDVWAVIEAAKTKPFGFQPFYPGPGLGGHCIPIDPFYLTWMARKYGVHTRFIELAGEINTGMPQYVVSRIGEALNEQGKPIKGSRICVLGVAYKRNVDDPRESPAFSILEMLKQRGAFISYNDPHIPQLPPMRHHNIRLDSELLTEEFLAVQDCVVIVTDHSVYSYEWIMRHSRLIVDTRNATAGLAVGPCRIVKA